MIPGKYLDGLRHALALGGGTHGVEDVIRQIEDRQAQLWGAENALIVTEIHETPRARVVHFWLATGDLDEVIGLSHSVLAWAKGLGCTQATLSGRKGWTRALKHEGWDPTLVIMSREV